MKQPWYETTLIRSLLDFHTPEWVPGVLDDMDIDDLVQTYKKAGIEVAAFDAKCCYGNCYYNTRTGHKHSQLGDRDLLGEFTTRAGAAGIKVVGYYLACWDTHAGTENPDWLCRDLEGKTTKAGGSDVAGGWPYLCINSPYRDFMLRQTEEIVQNYEIDAYMMDMVMAGTIGGSNHCYCDYCQRKFRGQFGTDIPESQDPANPLWRKFVEWRYRCVEGFLSQCRDLVKSIRPECAFTYNHLGWPYTRPDMGNRAEQPLDYCDYVMSEAYSQVWGITCPSFMSRFSRGASGGKPVQTFSFRFVDCWDFEIKSPMHLAYEMFTAASNGSSVCIIGQLYAGGKLEHQVYAEAKPVFDEIKARQEWIVGAKAITHVGLIYSQRTKDYYANNTPIVYAKPLVGVDKMMTEMHQNCEFIPDRHITRESLARFDVVIATNAVALADEEVEALRGYVADGGGLVASYLTSLWDAKAEARSNFGLAEVFGADFRQIYPRQVSYLWPVEGHPLAAELVQRPYLARCRDAAIIAARDGAETVATLVEPLSERVDGRYGAPRWYSNSPHMPPGRHTNTPIIVANRFGKGRAVYFAWNIGEAYAQFGYRHERQLLHAAVTWARQREPMLKIVGPMTLEATYWRKDKAFICHIVNPHFQKPGGWLDTAGLNPGTTGFITAEEDVTVAGVEVIIRADIKTARIVPSGQKLDLVREDGAVRVKLPPIGLWTTVELL